MILSICLPTYNRDKKALKTVQSLYAQISRSPNKDLIELVVSNNGSTDATQEVLTALNYADINFRIFNQPLNLGFDGNTKFLYQEARGQYVWYYGDDDILFEGTVDTVFDSIKNGQYGAMRFSFMQPKGSDELTFKFPANERLVITAIDTIIDCCFTLPKITTYVLKRVEATEELFASIKQYENGGYWFIALSVRIFEMLGSKSEGLLLYNKQLASSDEDVMDLRVEPEVWNNRVSIAKYPYIKQNYSKLEEKILKEDYLFTILLFWKYKKGEIKVHDNNLYDRYIKTFKVRIDLLKDEPLLLYWIMVIKLNLLPVHNGALSLVKKIRSK